MGGGVDARGRRRASVLARLCLVSCGDARPTGGQVALGSMSSGLRGIGADVLAEAFQMGGAANDVVERFALPQLSVPAQVPTDSRSGTSRA